LSWAEEVASRLGEKRAVEAYRERLQEGLRAVESLEDLRDLLGACSVLLYAGGLEQELLLPDLGRAGEPIDSLTASRADIAAIGLGHSGRGIVNALMASRHEGFAPLGFFIDVETSRTAQLDKNVNHVILESPDYDTGPGVPRLGDMLRAAYRAASGSNRPPPVLAEGLLNADITKLTIHVVAALEDPWVAILPDLLLDLQALARGSGGVVLHLVTRPSPRLKGSGPSVVAELERTRPFRDAFIVCATDEVATRQVEEFIRLSAGLSDLLVRRSESRRGGAFASYGFSPAPQGGDESAEVYLRRLDTCFQSAAPSWLPGKAPLEELVSENVFLIHAPACPPPENTWRLFPDLVPLPALDENSVLCRIQRGLRLADLRLV
jgi:hypothetical protein